MASHLFRVPYTDPGIGAYSDAQVALKQPIHESWIALRESGGTVKLKVAQGTQVNLDGTVYTEGQSFEPADDRSALVLIASGTAVDDSPVAAARPSAPSR
ncbi:MAG: hypothetical protein ABR529_11160 [Actinomycetota bacterium]